MHVPARVACRLVPVDATLGLRMTSVALLGATGNLGRHVAGQSLALGWDLSVAVRSRGRLPAEISARAQVTDLDLSSANPSQIASFAADHDVFVSCAGVVTEGEGFVRLLDKIVTALESLELNKPRVCWFLAGAAILPLDATGRLGVDLPKVRHTYWPHRKNHERLQRSALDWRLLCPGPMVEQPALGLQRLRVTIDALPAPLPAVARSLPAPLVLPLFAMRIPEMIIPYADAASVMLAHATPGGLHVEAPGRRGTAGRHEGEEVHVGSATAKRCLGGASVLRPAGLQWPRAAQARSTRPPADTVLAAPRCR
jgi:putative NADH-flavin reductase